MKRAVAALVVSAVAVVLLARYETHPPAKPPPRPRPAATPTPPPPGVQVGTGPLLTTPFSYAGKPVFVLTSGRTFSGGEEFAYDMQVLKRGIIVGERTPGAANHALPVSIQGGLTAFVPRARAENPVTGTNWEGTGIAPDELASPPTVAEAHRVLLQRLGTSTSKG